MSPPDSTCEPVKTILCYVEERGGAWEGFCLTFDLAVQGRSFDEVIAKLRDQAILYQDGLRDLPAPDRARLFHREMPRLLQLRLMWRAAWGVLWHRHDGGSPEGIVAVPTGLAMA
jgi:hypothetical protein